MNQYLLSAVSAPILLYVRTGPFLKREREQSKTTIKLSLGGLSTGLGGTCLNYPLRGCSFLLLDQWLLSFGNESKPVLKESSKE